MKGRGRRNDGPAPDLSVAIRDCLRPFGRLRAHATRQKRTVVGEFGNCRFWQPRIWLAAFGQIGKRQVLRDRVVGMAPVGARSRVSNQRGKRPGFFSGECRFAMCFGIWLDAVFFPLAGPCRTRQRAAPVRRRYIKVEIGKVCRGDVVPAGRILFGCFHRFINDLSRRRLRTPPGSQLEGIGSQQLSATLSDTSVFCISVDFSSTRSVLVASPFAALTVRHSGRRPELRFFQAQPIQKLVRSTDMRALR